MIYRLPAQPDNIRTFKDPNDPSSRRTVIALVRLSDLPQFPLNPDPRVPKQQSTVVKTIRDSALSNDGRFHEKNRGITLCVRSAEYSNQDRELMLDIPEVSEDGLYGVIDGGHTQYAISTAVGSASKYVHGTDGTLPNQFVRLEIMVGVEANLAEIAEARNFSVALKSWTLSNYMGKFDWFLDAVGDYKKYIRVKENDEHPTVPIMDLVQVMCAINPVLFPEGTAPLEAYKNAGKCLDYFVAENDPHCFQKFRPLCLDVLKLHDYIRRDWDTRYNAGDEEGKKGRIDRRVEMNKRKKGRDAMLTFYFLETSPVKKRGLPVEKGFAIPMMSAFRVLLEEDEQGYYRWTTDPFDFFDEHGTELVREVMEASSESGGDAHIVGRDPKVYRALYRIARIEVLESREETREKTRIRQKQLPFNKEQ